MNPFLLADKLRIKYTGEPVVIKPKQCLDFISYYLEDLKKPTHLSISMKNVNCYIPIDQLLHDQIPISSLWYYDQILTDDPFAMHIHSQAKKNNSLAETMEFIIVFLSQLSQYKSLANANILVFTNHFIHKKKPTKFSGISANNIHSEPIINQFQFFLDKYHVGVDETYTKHTITVGNQESTVITMPSIVNNLPPDILNLEKAKNHIEYSDIKKEGIDHIDNSIQNMTQRGIERVYFDFKLSQDLESTLVYNSEVHTELLAYINKHRKITNTNTLHFNHTIRMPYPKNIKFSDIIKVREQYPDALRKFRNHQVDLSNKVEKLGIYRTGENQNSAVVNELISEIQYMDSEWKSANNKIIKDILSINAFVAIGSGTCHYFDIDPKMLILSSTYGIIHNIKEFFISRKQKYKEIEQSPAFYYWKINK